MDITPDLLRRWPLPTPASDGDKEERGRILIVGGSREIPGAVILAANAALRAGAGKLTIVTGQSVAIAIAAQVPEARVIGLPETANGGLKTEELKQIPAETDAALIGPGMQDEPAIIELTRALLPRLAASRLVLDAGAMSVVRPSKSPTETTSAFESPPLLTPHAGEMAHLTGLDKQRIETAPQQVATEFSARWNADIRMARVTARNKCAGKPLLQRIPHASCDTAAAAEIYERPPDSAGDFQNPGPR